MKSLNEKMECYFTPEATTALKELENCGLEKDLAVAVLEQLWPEDIIYDIPSMEATWMTNE